EDGIRDFHVTGVQTCALPISRDYAVNIKTVRNAVALLESEGLVTPVRRRGTVVRSRPPMRRLGMERYAKSNWKFGDRVAFVADRSEERRVGKVGGARALVSCI